MVAEGIIRSRLSANNEVKCWNNHPECSSLADKMETTLSAAAVEFWRPQLAGAVVAIGNAPTTLFRLLEILAEGVEPPAVIFGFPVGFIGAAESKELLVKQCGGAVPYLTLSGRRGGSAMAAAAVNALAKKAEISVANNINIHLTIVGSGPQLTELKKLVKNQMSMEYFKRALFWNILLKENVFVN